MSRSFIIGCLVVIGCAMQAGRAGQAPGDKEFANSIGMRLVRIDPGSFSMGQQAGGDWDERPVHNVDITKTFYMAATEVTNEQYELFDPWHRHMRSRRGLSSANDEAVIFVNWHEAAAFCKWLSEREGRPYRLPTEAEWEYACRAATTSNYNTGDELADSYHKVQKRNQDPTPVDLTVGRTPANQWGLCDMHGNVEEWCLDWYGPYQAGAQRDPVGRQGGDFRVSRGGSHNTGPVHLRSANRHGSLPDDRHWLLGFRVVSGEMPKTKALSGPTSGLWSRAVVKKPCDWSKGPEADKPYFRGPQTYVKVPPNSNGPMFSKHNHDPGLTFCDNGDLLAIWYSGNGERGRELCILASRLRRRAKQWDDASPFWDTPDRNDHAPAMLNDGQDRLYHFNGLSAAQNYRKNLALIMRTSEDNGATWSRARLINPVRGVSNQPVASTFVTREGHLVFTSDWPWHKDGRGSAIWMSRDRGKTWSTPGGRIAGIHAGITQLKDGRLMALGRGSNINGRMPKSLSSNMGRTWTYEPTGFQPIGGGQRLVLLSLREGPLFAATFTKEIRLSDSAGNVRMGSGLYATISFDDGRSWPLRRLITDDSGRPIEAMDGKEFIMSATTAEPRGYMSGMQTPDGIIHLISSKQYYAFNLAWLRELPVPAAAGGSGIEHTDVFYGGELGYKEFRIPALVVTNSGVLLAISEAGRTASDFGDRDLLLRRSTDDGRTWSDIHLLRNKEKSTCGNPTVVVDRSNGRVHMFSTIDGGRVYHNYTDDDGVTWSQFRDITKTFEDFKGRFAWTRLATGSGLGIELARGKHKGRFIMTCWMTKDEKQYRSAVVYSDDRGATWKAGGAERRNVQHQRMQCLRKGRWYIVPEHAGRRQSSESRTRALSDRGHERRWWTDMVQVTV